jgi:hypothetical protein
VENTYLLKIMNLDQRPHDYRVAASGIDRLTLVAPADVRVAPGEIAEVPVRLQAPPDVLRERAYDVRFAVSATDADGVAVREKGRFLAPAAAQHEEESHEHEHEHD